MKIIVLSTYNDEHLIEKAKKLGANGYLLKTTNKDELLQTIRLVYKGQACFPYRKPAYRSEFDENDSFLKQLNLTKRELEILVLLKKKLYQSANSRSIIFKHLHCRNPPQKYHA